MKKLLLLLLSAHPQQEDCIAPIVIVNSTKKIWKVESDIQFTRNGTLQDISSSTFFSRFFSTKIFRMIPGIIWGKIWGQIWGQTLKQTNIQSTIHRARAFIHLHLCNIHTPYTDNPTNISVSLLYPGLHARTNFKHFELLFDVTYIPSVQQIIGQTATDCLITTINEEILKSSIAKDNKILHDNRVKIETYLKYPIGFHISSTMILHTSQYIYADAFVTLSYNQVRKCQLRIAFIPACFIYETTDA